MASPRGDSKTIEETIDQVHVVKEFLRGGTEESPLVIGLHGRGGTPRNFARIFADYGGTIELVLVQGFYPVGDGFQWVGAGPSSSDEEFAKALSASEDRLWPVLEKLAHGRKMIVTGFSQGAFMTYVLATRHAGAIAYAFPISGLEPPLLFPHDHAATAPVHALHGTDDGRVSIDDDRATIDAFMKNGSVADLREFPSTAHIVSTAMQEDLREHIGRVVAEFAPSAK
jgi:phospholipase/carboxylesterase